MLTTTLARGAAAVLLALTATTVTAAPALAEGGHHRDAKRTYTITQTWDVPKGSTDFQWMECQVGQDKRVGKSLRTTGGASARWTGSGDMEGQVTLRFATRDEAVAYAAKNGIAYQLFEPKPRSPVLRQNGYGDNFASQRRMAWTH